jgi:hypothetical protein
MLDQLTDRCIRGIADCPRRGAYARHVSQSTVRITATTSSTWSLPDVAIVTSTYIRAPPRGRDIQTGDRPTGGLDRGRERRTINEFEAQGRGQSSYPHACAYLQVLGVRLIHCASAVPRRIGTGSTT